MNTKPYCDCRSQGKWAKQDGWARQTITGLWLHNGCQRPSRAFVDEDGSYTLYPKILIERIPPKQVKIHEEADCLWT